MKPNTPWGRSLTKEEAEAYLGPDTFQLFRQQLFLVLLDRLGGEVTIPVSEVDATGKFVMNLHIDQDAKNFTLQLVRKS